MSNAGTSQGNEWRFGGQININSCSSNPVSCGMFDPYEEIYWTGSSNGKVSSWLPTNNYARYTAFVVSKTSGVHHLEPTENAIFSLTDTVLRATSKQGVPLTAYSAPTMQRMTALCRLPGTSTFVMGGFQNKLILYDFAKEKEIRTAELHQEETAVIIRYNGTNTYSADTKGRIHVKNPKNYETIQVIGCHTERVLDFDVQGTMMITCGVSVQSSSPNSDKFLKLYDLRANKHLPPIVIHNSPQFVRFIPSYCARIACVYQNFYHQDTLDFRNNGWNNQAAGIRMFDLSTPNCMTEFAIDSPLVTSFDCSSNKNFLAVGNNMGKFNRFVTLFTDQDHPMVNENSKETVFAVPPVQPPLSFVIDDMSNSVGSIPMPFPHDPLVSDWPSEFTQIVHRRKRDPVEWKNVKSIHYATQISNPRIGTNLKFYNVVPYILEQEQPFIKIPSDQVCFDSPLPSSEKVKVPMLYKKRPPHVAQVPTRRGKPSEDTLETYSWNVIRHITLQSTYGMNMVANAVVQVVYYLGALRNIVLRHICTEASCITCELHFLFSTFPSKIGPDEEIVTTNLAWALARNGVSLKTGGVLSAIQQVIRTTFNDVANKDGSSSIRNKFDRHLRCIRCSELQDVEEGSEYLLTLNYLNHASSFCRILEKALTLGADSGERECSACKQMSRMECKRKIVGLSPVLLINTNTSAEGYLEFWQRQLSEHESRPRLSASSAFVPESPLEKKHCRYGEGCRDKKSCKFVHGHIDWAAEQTRLLEDIDGVGWNHYIPSRIAAQVCDGIVRITDISDAPAYDEHDAVIYELDAMIHLIGNGQQEVNWTHPVTLLRESPVASTAWTLINELLVSRLHDHEARHVDARWKLPALIAYRKKGTDVSITEGNISDDLFFDEKNFAIGNAESTAIKTTEELPKKGELVGLDTEFIKIKTSLLEFNGRTVQTKALGRASCLDVTGEKVIFDDHIKLDEDLEVVDYLTKYSGIVESDLSPETSDKYLSTHKRLLLRMHVLLQRGVIFVGHALHNDFSVMNVHITEPQIIDTVNLWRLDAQRMLSLQFLVKEVLGESIQQLSHDSVVDARYSLKLYHKCLEMKASGIFGPEMRRMYTIMPLSCSSPNPGASPLTVSTLRQTTNESASAAPRSV